MESTRWWTYLSEVMGDDTATKAAKKTGISASNFTRWKQGANADPEFVVKVARAYKVNVRRALVEANFIAEEEAGFIKEQPGQTAVSYTHLTLPTTRLVCRSRWSPYH